MRFLEHSLSEEPFRDSLRDLMEVISFNISDLPALPLGSCTFRNRGRLPAGLSALGCWTPVYTFQRWHLVYLQRQVEHCWDSAAVLTQWHRWPQRRACQIAWPLPVALALLHWRTPRDAGPYRICEASGGFLTIQEPSGLRLVPWQHRLICLACGLLHCCLPEFIENFGILLFLIEQFGRLKSNLPFLWFGISALYAVP